MASLSTEAGGNRRVQFTALDRRRKAVRLGKVSRDVAERVREMIGRLNAAVRAGDPPDEEVAAWVDGLDDAVHAKLAATGLVVARAPSTVGAFADAYAASRTDLKEQTRQHLVRCAADLRAHFGPDRPLRSVTPGDADDYRLHLAETLGRNTVARRVGRAKQVFHAAVRKELIGRNPFAGQKTQVRGNPDKFHFVTREEAERVLAACPDAQWRLIVALARFGGLRCVSELLPLTWDDVDWERNRMTVHSPKTEHHEGRAKRTIPLFPELREHLQAARREAAPGEAFVVTHSRDRAANLRTTFLRIVKRAELTPWPKPFQNMRATRQTELAASHPEHVVCAWIGNSQAVAREHYLRVTDADFDRASAPAGGPGGDERGAESGALAARNPAQHAAAPGGMKERVGEQTPTQQSGLPVDAAGRRSVQGPLNPRPGFEPGLTEPKSVVLPLHHRGTRPPRGRGAAGRAYRKPPAAGRQDDRPAAQRPGSRDAAVRAALRFARRRAVRRGSPLAATLTACPPRSPRRPGSPTTVRPARAPRRRPPPCGPPRYSTAGRSAPRAAPTSVPSPSPTRRTAPSTPPATTPSSSATPSPATPTSPAGCAPTTKNPAGGTASSGTAPATGWTPTVTSSSAPTCWGGAAGRPGPGSVNPDSGRPWGLRFPFVTLGDIVEVHAELVREVFGIDRLRAVIGGSLGGMQALEWAVRFPERVGAAIAIASAATLGPQGIGFNAVGRRAILTDPHFRGGDYHAAVARGGDGPDAGLALARMLAHITYLSEANIARKFGRRLQHTADPEGFKHDIAEEVQFQVESYLDYQGRRFTQRFDANSLLYLTRAMDHFDLARGRGSLAAALERARARFLILSYTTDWLFPTAGSREVVRALLAAGGDVTFAELDSPYGHDAFLIEEELPRLGRIVGAFLG